MRLIRNKGFVLLIMSLAAKTVSAQSYTLVDSLESNKALAVSTDALGHFYVLSEGNQLLKYNNQLELLQTYSSPTLSRLSTLEARQMLKVFVFYESSQEFQFFDRFLTPSPAAQVKSAPFSHYSVASMSNDQMLWLYDDNNIQLVKYNPMTEEIVLQVDLKYFLPDQAKVKILQEYGNRLYLWQNDQLMIFDFLGNLIQSLTLDIQHSFSFDDTLLYFPADNSIFTYNLKSKEQKKIDLSISANIRFGICLDRKLIVFTDHMIKVFSEDL